MIAGYTCNTTTAENRATDDTSSTSTHITRVYRTYYIRSVSSTKRDEEILKLIDDCIPKKSKVKSYPFKTMMMGRQNNKVVRRHRVQNKGG